MPAKIDWTDEMDAAILTGRADRQPWDAIAAGLGLSRWAVIRRGRFLGADRRRLRRGRAARAAAAVEREPFPAGHPITWGAITAGTVLAGAVYRYQTPVVTGQVEPAEAAAEPVREAA